MADAAADPKPADVLRREADTDSLRALTGVLTPFVPAIGEARQPGTAADESAPGLAGARNLTLLAILAGIETLANRLAAPWPES